MAKYCSNCGNEVSDVAIFCKHCGNKIELSIKNDEENIIEMDDLEDETSALPAKYLEYACYRSMFEGCTDLTIAPNIGSTEDKIIF